MRARSLAAAVLMAGSATHAAEPGGAASESRIPIGDVSIYVRAVGQGVAKNFGFIDEKRQIRSVAFNGKIK